MGWCVSRNDNCAVEGFQEVWEEEINRKEEKRHKVKQNSGRGWGEDKHRGCGEDPARERAESGDGAFQTAKKRTNCLFLSFRLLSVQCPYVSSGIVAAQPKSIYEWCLQGIKA